MKNSIKLIAAAALVATSGFASAAINSGGTGDGEVFFRAYDASSKITYYMDTGLAMSELLPTTGLVQSFSLDGFAGFLSTANLAETTWGVYAVDVTSPVNIYTTAFQATVNAPIISRVTNIKGYVQQSAIAANNYAADPLAEDGYSIVATSTNGLGADLKFSNNTPFVAAGNVLTNTTATFHNIGIVGSTVKMTQFGAAASPTLWKLDTANASLTIVPVPEPSTYALAIAGLAVVGALSRRNKKAAK